MAVVAAPRLVALVAAIVGSIAIAPRALAEQEIPPNDDDPSRWLKELDVEAGSLEADVRLRELDLRDGVKVRLSPYYLRADRVHLSMTPWGVRVKGDGVLTFCPCDDPPISIGFSGGYAGPPDELIVEDPTLRVFGVPVFWLPYLWLRSPRKVGLTMPQVSFRGGDGLFLGQGVHLPIGAGLELGVGAYTRGGFAASADFATARTFSRVRYDFRSAPEVGARDDIPSGGGLAIDAHGDLGDLRARSAPSWVWDLDAIRGARGLRTTLDLEPLARPFDRAATEVRMGPVGVGVDVVDRRGDALDRYGFARPYAALFGSTALGELGGTSARATLGPRFVRARKMDALADVSWGVELGAPLGITMLHATTELAGRAAHAGGSDRLDPLPPIEGGRAAAVVVEGRLEWSLPLARNLRLDRAAGGPPVVHVIEPLLRLAGVGARGGGDREALAGFAAAPVLDAANGSNNGSTASTTIDARTVGAAYFALGARTALGAMAGGIAPGRDPWIGKLTAEVATGALVTDGRRDATAAGELAFTTRRADGGGWQLALQGAVARTLRRDAIDSTLGWVALGRVHVDTSRDGLRLELRAAARGAMPVIGGWAILGADAAPRLTTATGLGAPGSTFGVGTGFPIGLGLRLGGDVDAFADTIAGFARKDDRKLLDVHSTLRYRHPCGCFRLGVRGGHVVGREGVDVFATLELARLDPNDPRDW